MQLLKIIFLRLIPLPRVEKEKRINGITFKFDFALDPQIKNMYQGTYEINTIEVMKKLLRKGDVFIDVGANIGYVSAIALGVVGKGGAVHSFEPVPELFNRLQNIAAANKEYKHVVNRCAVGEIDGFAKIAVTNVSNIGWNTIVPGFMSAETTKEIITVPIRRLDGYIQDNSLVNIALIKIDTEGFEFLVLKGMSNYFANTAERPLIICEIAPEAYSHLGCSLAQLSDYMKSYGYSAFSLNNANSEIDILSLQTTTNILFKAD